MLISISKYEEYIKRKLSKEFEISRIDKISKLPRGIKYLTWSIGQSEVDRSFKVIGKNKGSDTIELYVQV